MLIIIYLSFLQSIVVIISWITLNYFIIFIPMNYLLVHI